VQFLQLLACLSGPPEVAEVFVDEGGAELFVSGRIVDIGQARVEGPVLALLGTLDRVHGGEVPPAFFGGQELRQDLAMLADLGVSHVALAHGAAEGAVGRAVAGIFGTAAAVSEARVIYTVPQVEASEQELAMWRVLHARASQERKVGGS
jgi:hypothetical protein